MFILLINKQVNFLPFLVTFDKNGQGFLKILSTIGTMVAHSILLGGHGFPFLAKFCYHYLTFNETLQV